ncbi:MAG: hypothetical protein ACT4N2_03330 [Hyphomicrobium sp.]
MAAIPAVAPGGARAEEAAPQRFAVVEVPFECRDFRGQRVVVMQSPGLGDVARARIIGRIPYIQMDPDRLATLPPKMQMFFYGHECAHHLLGHNYYPTPTVEVDADCWSIMHGRKQGLFTREEVDGFKPYLAHSKGSVFGHLPGPERAAHLLKCYDDPRELAKR